VLSPGDNLSDGSLEIAEGIMALEPAFAIEIPDEEAEKIRTVEDAMDYVRSKKGHLN
jgi:acyl carrier protein